MSEAFEELFAGTKAAFSQERTFVRARTLAISSLVGFGRRTVSGMLCTSAQQFTDWSAAYRLFTHERFDSNSLFEPVRRTVLESLAPEEPLVMFMDDTLTRTNRLSLPPHIIRKSSTMIVQIAILKQK